MPFYAFLWHIVARCEAILPHRASPSPFQGTQGHIPLLCEFRVAARMPFFWGAGSLNDVKQVIGTEVDEELPVLADLIIFVVKYQRDRL